MAQAETSMRPGAGWAAATQSHQLQVPSFAEKINGCTDIRKAAAVRRLSVRRRHMPIHAEVGGAEERARGLAVNVVIGSRARPDGPANVLAMGTANPPTVIEQTIYPDYYFGVTGANEMVELKRKFRRICDNTAIRKRHTIISPEVLASNPNFYASSLDARQSLVLPALLELADQASSLALSEWGRPSSHITHLVYSTSVPGNYPGADLHLAKRLGLRAGVRRVGLLQQGCYGGAAALRVARDIAESTRGARVLVVCAETASVIFRPPDAGRVDRLVAAALFGDGAAAAVIGADPEEGWKESQPLFQMLSASQTVLPGTEEVISGELTEAGLTVRLDKDVPSIVAGAVDECLRAAAEEASAADLLPDWNSMFWVVHPGGRAILDKVEERLRLRPEKLRKTRKMLEEYGNMAGASVLFVMDEMRRRSMADGMATTGEGKELGALLAFGPGVTAETILLRSFVAGARPSEEDN